MPFPRSCGIRRQADVSSQRARYARALGGIRGVSECQHTEPAAVAPTGRRHGSPRPRACCGPYHLACRRGGHSNPVWTRSPRCGRLNVYRRSRNDCDTSPVSVAWGPGVTPVAPRLAQKLEIPIRLYCGFPRCGTGLESLTGTASAARFRTHCSKSFPEVHRLFER
jgi:hypothetical protein